MKLLIAGGGTGGHLFSGVAVAEILSEEGNHELLFVGTKNGIEARILPKLNYPLALITVGGLKRMGLFKTLLNLIKLPISLLQSCWIVLRFWPDMVLGVGGYASGPLVLAAWLLGRPTAIIEQNSRPGVTNRILGKRVRAVITHFARAEAFFPAEKVHRLGNPIRTRILEQAEQETTKQEKTSDIIRILVTGGSQGAHAINETVAKALLQLPDYHKRLFVHHQSGSADAPWLQQTYTEANVQAEVSPFIDDMISAYQAADLVICRAGAGTCAELAIVGRPALFVPLPTAADDHQAANAQELVDNDGAWMVRQPEFTPDFLASFLKDRLADPEELTRRGQAAKMAGRPKATVDTVELLKRLAGLSSSTASSRNETESNHE